MKKKVISCLLIAAMVSTMAAGCGSGSGNDGADAASDDGKVTITIGGWPTKDNEQYEIYQGYLETMNELYPDIEVVPDEYLYTTDTFLPKAASGQLPDLYLTWFTEIDKIVSAGYAADITETLEKNEVLDTINPDLLAEVESDGKYYGIPKSAYSMSMMYNVNLFKEAGLVDENGVPIFPQTWDELAQTAVTIKEKTGKPGFFFPTTSNHGGWMFTNIAWSFGAEFEEQQEDGSWKAVFDSPEAVAALEYIKDLRWTYDVLPENTLGDLNDFANMYGTDQVAMGLCHLNMTKSIVTSTGMSKDNFAVSTIPEGPAGKAAQLGGDVYMMAPDTTPEQQDAIMKWLTVTGESPVFTDEAMEGFEARYSGLAEQGVPVGPMGVRIWTSGDRVQKEDEILAGLTNVDMNLWNPYCEHASENLRSEPPVNAQELYKALDSVIQEVLTNENADCQALLSQAAADFQSDYLDKAEN